MDRRTYKSVLPFFHNFEHDPKGLTHCRGGAKNPYKIRHQKKKHIIDKAYARGHGKGQKSQWFKFESKIGDGYDLVSGRKISVKDVPSEFK